MCHTTIEEKKLPGAAKALKAKADRYLNKAWELKEHEDIELMKTFLLRKMEEEGCDALELAAVMLKAQVGDRGPEIEADRPVSRGRSGERFGDRRGRDGWRRERGEGRGRNTAADERRGGKERGRNGYREEEGKGRDGGRGGRRQGKDGGRDTRGERGGKEGCRPGVGRRTGRYPGREGFREDADTRGGYGKDRYREGDGKREERGIAFARPRRKKTEE